MTAVDRSPVDDVIVRSFAVARDDAAARLADVDPAADVWEALELDSMDNIAVLTRLGSAVGQDIPERDLPRLLTLEAIRTYVEPLVP